MHPPAHEATPERPATAEARWHGRVMGLRFIVAAVLLTGVVASQADTGVALPPPDVELLRAWRAEMTSPTRLATDDLGTIYITDPGRGQVLARAADGSVRWRHAVGGSPLGIAVDREGRILVGDSATGAVTAYDPETWTAAYVLGGGAGEFLLPADIAVAADTGRIYVADAAADTVAIFDPGGASVSRFGGSGSDPGQFSFPIALDVDPATGNLHVVDQRNHRVQIVAADGTWLSTFGEYGDEDGQFQSPQGIWTDTSSRIWVADAAVGTILVFDTDGELLDSIGEYGETPGSFRLPTDVLVDASGRLVVASANNARLELFGVDSYSDPEQFAPAFATLPTAEVDPEAAFFVHLEVPGYKLEEVDAATLRANGVGVASVGEADADNDGEPELVAEFDGAVLAATLPDGSGTLLLEAELDTLALSIEPLPVSVKESGTDTAPPGAGTTATSAVHAEPRVGTPASHGGPGSGGCGGCASSPAPVLVLLLPLLRRRPR